MKNPSPRGNVKIKTYHCRNRLPLTFEVCNAAAFATDGARLYIDGKLMPYKPFMVGWTCKRCGGLIRWNAKSQPEQKKDR